MLSDECAERAGVPLSADPRQVPHGMTQDHQYIWIFVKHSQQWLKLLLLRSLGVLTKLRQNRFGLRAGQVMQAQMQSGIAKRYRPLQRHGNSSRLRYDPQKHGSFDIVVVGERNHAAKTEHIFNLSPFELKGSQSGHRRRPVGFPEINLDGGNIPRAALLMRQRPAQGRMFRREFSDEIQSFFGML